MRKVGIFSILHYLAYFLIGVCIIRALSGSDAEMYDNIAAGILVLFSLLFLSYGGIGLLLNLLRLIFRLPFFGVLCMLFDLHGIIGWISLCTFSAEIIPAEYLSYMAVFPAVAITAAVLSLVSNALTLKK